MEQLTREELIVIIYNLEMELFRISRDSDMNGGVYDSNFPSLKTVINKLRQILLTMEEWKVMKVIIVLKGMGIVYEK